jgi:hypothetical protein
MKVFRCFLVVLLLLAVAAKGSSSLWALSSSSNADGTQWFAGLGTVNSEKGTFTQTANITFVGGVTSGHVFRWLKRGTSFAVLSLSNVNTENYFYDLSLKGVPLVHFSTQNVLLSGEVVNGIVYVTTIVNKTSALATISPPYTELQPLVLFGESYQNQLIIGCTATINGVVYAAFEGGNGSFVIGYSVANRTMTKLTFPSKIGELSSLEVLGGNFYALTFSTTSYMCQLWRIPIAVPGAATLVASMDQNYPSCSGATALSTDGKTFYTQIGDSNGVYWKVTSIDLSTGGVTYYATSTTMLVSFLSQ